jgi:hypothetical protein
MQYLTKGLVGRYVSVPFANATSLRYLLHILVFIRTYPRINAYSSEDSVSPVLLGYYRSISEQQLNRRRIRTGITGTLSLK